VVQYLAAIGRGNHEALRPHRPVGRVR
jgi:hypothetical protein